MKLRLLYDVFAHRFLRIPYVLHSRVFRTSKRPKVTFVFIHGIGNTLHAWDDVAKQLPEGVRAIGIDLLGFGASAKPSWAQYSAKTQARSVAVTLLRLGIRQRVVLVGHSLGALVAVEVARRHPLLVSRLVLCSPPFYNPEAPDASGIVKSPEDILRALYRAAKKYPDALAQFSAVAVKAGIANKSLAITDENVGAYFAALEASIINQTSLRDIRALRLPIDILYGILDPVIISSNIVQLGKDYPNITVKRYLVGHEVLGAYVRGVVKWLSGIVRRAEDA